MNTASCQSSDYIIKHSEHGPFHCKAADKVLILKLLEFLFFGRNPFPVVLRPGD